LIAVLQSFPNSLKDLQAKVELVADCMRMLPRDFVQSLFLSASQVPLIRWLYSSQQLDWYDEQWIRFEQHFTSQLSSIRLRAENEWRNALVRRYLLENIFKIKLFDRILLFNQPKIQSNASIFR
jgi:hypothetical protein